MTITFSRLDPTGADRGELIGFMTQNRFPFHVRTQLTVGEVDQDIVEGAYRDDDNDSYWIEHSDLGRIGFFRLEDLSEEAPLFDLRLQESVRGKGLGVDILKAAAELVFTTMPAVIRFEGQTREDNIAMRKTFLRSGWLKEAHYRQGWPVTGAEPVASVAYSILRQDWASGTTTTFVWEDLQA